MKLLGNLFLILSLQSLAIAAGGALPVPSNPPEGVHVDSTGVLRWNGSNTEVSLFGVNYTTPFAYSYRAHEALGLDLKKSIDLDVAQMARLGFDGFRVHVWDREVSDSVGNLLNNQHLDLLDYLLKDLSDRGIRIILTPIGWWGTGWPEPDQPAPGFSQRYSKPELITNQAARLAQRNYLRQFITHINPYRKAAYRDDPSIIAIEIINEPHHPANLIEVTGYVNDMASVLRNAGFVKPLFYNISENWTTGQANAVAGANIDGVTFQWYPTDLVHGSMLKGGYLLNVSQYLIPADSVPLFNKRARMVYEFDAADVGGSYMYPAIARSFREAGMQFAAMFSYDPSQIAWSNTEYPTHFHNLLYTPSKAISAMIAAKAFHRLPRLKSFGTYPANSRFDDFRVSEDEDLSELNSDSEFVYSNDTRTAPKSPEHLSHVAGCGNSSLVTYDGTGAYFLDRLEKGVWRLEVCPDVLWLRDPFESPGMSRQVARLLFARREMTIRIPDLGENFSVWPWSGRKPGESSPGLSTKNLTPGVYMLTAPGVDRSQTSKRLVRNESFLEGLYRPDAPAPGVYVINKTSPYIERPGPDDFRFEIAGELPVTRATLSLRRPGWRGFSTFPLTRVRRFEYALTDTPKIMQPGIVEFVVAVETGGRTWTFPEGREAVPGRWDFGAKAHWSVRFLQRGEPVVVFDAARDSEALVFSHYSPSTRYLADIHNGRTSEESSLFVEVSFTGEQPTPFGFQLNIADRIKSVQDLVGDYKHLVVQGRSSYDSTTSIRIVLVGKDGASCGANVSLSRHWNDADLSVSDFRSCSALMLPDHYPRFLPLTWKLEHQSVAGLPDFRSLRRIQVIAEPPAAGGHKKDVEFELQRVILAP